MKAKGVKYFVKGLLIFDKINHRKKNLSISQQQPVTMTPKKSLPVDSAQIIDIDLLVTKYLANENEFMRIARKH